MNEVPAGSRRSHRSRPGGGPGRTRSPRTQECLTRDAADAEVFRYARLNRLLLVTCNRDDFLALAATEPTFGLIILIRRRSRMAECGELLRLIDRAGEAGLRGNINYA